jgi:uncharacterized membrane protein YgcG
MRAPIHTAIAAVLFGATTTAATFGAALNNEVGDVETIQESAYGTPPDAAKEAKHPGDGVAYQELLETRPKSGMRVKLDDGSKLTIGANSKVRIDDFVFDKNNAESKALISLPAGALRYVTGSMPKGHTVIDTPTATMTLRGTNVKVTVDALGRTHLVVDEGSVSVHSKITGQDSVVNEGDNVDVSASGISAGASDAAGDPVVDKGILSRTRDYTSVEQRRRGDPPRQTSTKAGGNRRSSSGSEGGGGSDSGGGGSDSGGSSGG